MNTEQLKECMEEHGHDMFAFCKRLTGNISEAEDLFQDTFLKCMELGKEVDKERNPKGYLATIAIQIWKNRKRKFAWRQRIAKTETLLEETIGDMECTSSSPEQMVMDRELRKLVQKAVAELADQYRLPVYLYYTLELSVEEIAAVLHIPKGTVKSRLYKARILLKKKLEVSVK